MQPYALYKVYDELNRVIYIGVSSDPELRMWTHRNATKWFRREAVHYSVYWFPNFAEAHAVEAEAIRAEDPDHNFQHTEMARIVSQTPNEDRRRVNAELRAARAARIASVKAAIVASRNGEGVAA